MKRHIVNCIVSLIMLLSICGLSMTASALGPTVGTGGYMYIRAIKSGKYIDVPDGIVGNKKQLQIYTGNETLSQQWNIITFPDEMFLIQSRRNPDYYITVDDSTVGTNGGKIVLEYFPSGTVFPTRSIFGVVHYDEYGVAMIFNKTFLETGTLRFLEASGGNTANGAKLVQWTSYATLDQCINQLWVFEGLSRSIPANVAGLVDSNGYCDYDGSTKYESQFNTAISAWNNYMGVSRFRKDTATIIQDVKIRDRAKSSTNPNAAAEININDGSITFYTDIMDSYKGNTMRVKTIMHELGHALGLNDIAYQQGDIMNKGAYAYYTSLSLDDKAHYQQRQHLY